MVARVNSGKSIRGILAYNENKVKKGVARCLDALGFGCDLEDLSFKNKLLRFTNLTDRNKVAKTNAIHISLNFSPEDKTLSDHTLKEIAATYMEKIGFGDQPYLVYVHEDASHPHIHIATVNIQADGKRINTHNIGENESEVARKEIEASFNLIRAEKQEQKVNAAIKPAALQLAQYGKSATKNALSNIVRTVAKYYRYGNFKEYNDILRQFNVLADRGEPSSKMHKKGGLLYQILDPLTGKGVGIPLKSSAIYEKPTLKNIEAKYQENKQSKQYYRQRMARTIDKALQQSANTSEFIKGLKEENIVASFKSNEVGYIYGITFIDNTTCCFFNGSDVGKSYSAKNILERLQTGSEKDNDYNRDFVAQLLEKTDFSKSFPEVLSGWMNSGALVHAFDCEDGMTYYKIGNRQTVPASFIPAIEKMSGYFRANKLNAVHTRCIIDKILPRLFPPVSRSKSDQDWQETPLMQKELTQLLHELLEPEYGSYGQPVELLKEARKKKKKRSSY